MTLSRYSGTLLLLLALPCAAHAQSMTGGVAVNLIGGAPLACVEVALEDRTGAVVAETRTGTTGAFQFLTPDSGTYALRFTVDGWEPLRTEAITLSLEKDNLREYRLVFPTEQRAKPLRDEKAKHAPVGARLPATGPRYPVHERSIGREGEVLAQFVVDSTGRPVPSTIRMLRSTHAAFTQAVLDYLPRASYFPALRDSRPVCALVQQPFVFRIGDGAGGLPAVPPR